MSILVYRVDSEACEIFISKYPKIVGLIKRSKGKNILSAYKHFLRLKEGKDSQLGASGEFVDSPSFGSKTFYKYDWGNVKGHWPEVFQYVYNK